MVKIYLAMGYQHWRKADQLTDWRLPAVWDFMKTAYSPSHCWSIKHSRSIMGMKGDFVPIEDYLLAWLFIENLVFMSWSSDSAH